MRTEIIPSLPLSRVQTFPRPPRHLKISLVRPSLSWDITPYSLIWQDRLNFTAFFSVTAIYLETATTPPPLAQNFPP